jgi:hypothetical protein
MDFPLRQLSAGDARVETALDRLVRLSWLETPLKTVRADLEAKLDIPVVLHTTRLEEAGIKLETTVTLDLPEMPARRAISQLLRDFSLSSIVRDGQFFITTRDFVYDHVQPVRLYDVRPLTDPDLGLIAAAELQQLLYDVVDPTSWDRGAGSIQSFRGLLVSGQSEENHWRMTELLSALETHCLRGDSHPDASEWLVQIDSVPAEARIEKLLALPTKVDFCGEPLARALRRLADEHEIPLAVESECEEFLDQDNPFTFTATHVTLGGVLDRITEHYLGLEYYVRENSIVISLRDEERLDTRLYRVDDLVQRGVILPESLLATMNPAIWDDAGGQCVLRSVSGGWLIVMADRESHDQIEDWLSEQKTGQRSQRASDRLGLAAERAAIERIRKTYDPFASPPKPTANDSRACKEG